ncbi:MAG TPA: DUF5777 family beta-barrel protein [Bacteroidia bacterium]|nr:DUF5777 family beta-barrel protein [Bacteroidia bacterium]
MNTFCKILFLLILIPFGVHSQDFLFTDNPEVTDAFRSTVLINGQTTRMPSKNGWEFHIRHRFGAIKVDDSFLKNFLGTDLVANIRFSFVFPLSDKMFVGVGRTKFGKTYDLEVKRIVFTQTTDNSMPVSIAAYFNAACMSDDFAPVPKYAYFGDGITPFAYTFRHRLSYNSQLIVSRKFGTKFSAMLTPVFIYRNLVAPGQDNHTLNLTAGLAFKTSTNASILAEYAYRFNNGPANGYYPLTLGVEFGTVGHAFQIVISSVRDLQEQQIYSSETTDYLKGEFLFGFNIRRTFWYKKKKANEPPILQ